MGLGRWGWDSEVLGGCGGGGGVWEGGGWGCELDDDWGEFLRICEVACVWCGIVFLNGGLVLSAWVGLACVC